MSARWIVDVTEWSPCKEELAVALACIQAEEQDRILRFRFCNDAKMALIGRLMLRRYICDTLMVGIGGRGNPGILMGRSEYGKPEVKRIEINNEYKEDNFEISFNVSHDHKFAILAGEPRRALLGCDVSKVIRLGQESVDEFLDSMKDHFTPVEFRNMHLQGERLASTAASLQKAKESCIPARVSLVRLLSSSPSYGTLIAFHCHWALKEAFIKAIGKGLSFELHRLTFEIDSFTWDDVLEKNAQLRATLLIDSARQNLWQFTFGFVDLENCIATAMCLNADFCPELLCEFSGPLLSTSSREVQGMNDKSLESYKQITPQWLLEGMVPLSDCDVKKDHWWRVFQNMKNRR
eukprot:Nk52_evm8s539 gene=Nk52_evmTU8s539